MSEEDTKNWWDGFAVAGGLPQLETWLGGVDAASRVRVRERIAECQYDSVVDCGAGLGIDAYGMTNLSHPCTYTGVEPSRALRNAVPKLAERWGRLDAPPNIIDGNIYNLPLPDKSADLVYARHIFEHLPHIEGALDEMLRVARLEVIVVFFMRPGAETYLTREKDGLWQNRWSKPEVERLVEANPRTEAYFWETLGSEVLLHVYVSGAVTVDFGRIQERLA